MGVLLVSVSTPLVHGIHYSVARADRARSSGSRVHDSDIRICTGSLPSCGGRFSRPRQRRRPSWEHAWPAWRAAPSPAAFFGSASACGRTRATAAAHEDLLTTWPGNARSGASPDGLEDGGQSPGRRDGLEPDARSDGTGLPPGPERHAFRGVEPGRPGPGATSSQATGHQLTRRRTASPARASLDLVEDIAEAARRRQARAEGTLSHLPVALTHNDARIVLRRDPRGTAIFSRPPITDGSVQAGPVRAGPPARVERDPRHFQPALTSMPSSTGSIRPRGGAGRPRQRRVRHPSRRCRDGFRGPSA